jgi:hypothetical protein
MNMPPLTGQKRDGIPFCQYAVPTARAVTCNVRQITFKFARLLSYLISNPNFRHPDFAGGKSTNLATYCR